MHITASSYNYPDLCFTLIYVPTWNPKPDPYSNPNPNPNLIQDIHRQSQYFASFYTLDIRILP